MIKQLYDMWYDSPTNKKIMVITGESFYNKTLQDLDYNILNLENLLSNPHQIWNYIYKKRNIINNFHPNINHYSLVKLENFFHENFLLVSNNIDNLHIHAGNSKLIEVNGNIFKEKKLTTKEMGFLNIDWNNIPTNKNGEFLRPDILLKDEKINKNNYLRTYLFAQQCDICLIIGDNIKTNDFDTLPLLAKKFNNAKIIEINEKESYFLDSDIYINEKIENILPILTNLMMELEDGIKKKSNN